MFCTFLFLGNLTLLKKLLNLRPPDFLDSLSSTCSTGGLGNSLLGWSTFNCTMWACLGGRAGNFLTGFLPINSKFLLFRPLCGTFHEIVPQFYANTVIIILISYLPNETRSIFMGFSCFVTSWGESLHVLLLWIPLSSVRLSPLEEELDLQKSTKIRVYRLTG